MHARVVVLTDMPPRNIENADSPSGAQLNRAVTDYNADSNTSPAMQIVSDAHICYVYNPPDCRLTPSVSNQPNCTLTHTHIRFPLPVCELSKQTCTGKAVKVIAHVVVVRKAIQPDHQTTDLSSAGYSIETHACASDRKSISHTLVCAHESHHMAPIHTQTHRMNNLIPAEDERCAVQSCRQRVLFACSYPHKHAPVVCMWNAKMQTCVVYVCVWLLSSSSSCGTLIARTYISGDLLCTLSDANESHVERARLRSSFRADIADKNHRRAWSVHVALASNCHTSSPAKHEDNDDGV